MAASQPLIPFDEIDLGTTLYDIEAIREANPHRHEMELLDRIVLFNPDAGLIVGTKKVREDEFWVRGHFPHKALFPGVLMLEATGQLCSFYCKTVVQHDRTMVFAAAQNVRFRGMVEPGDDLVIQGRMLSMRRTATRFEGQCWVGDRLVFEGEITGMLV